MVAQDAAGFLKEDAVDEEQGAGGVEGARQEGEDQARVPGEGIGELEGGDVGEGPAERKEQVAEEEAVKGETALVGHEKGPRDEEEGAKDAADAGAEVVEDGADGQCSDVGAHSGHCEHEIEVNLDAGIDVDILQASSDKIVGRLLTADILVGAFLLEDRFQGCVAEDYACCEEAVDDGDEDLHYIVSLN